MDKKDGKTGRTERIMKLNGRIDCCYADVPIGRHTVCVGFRGGIVETYVNEYHFVVDEITSAALVRGRKVRYLRLTEEFEDRLIEIIENETRNGGTLRAS